MTIKKAVVPVAGIGTRLLPTTKALPKEMLPVGRLPIIHRVIEELVAAGITQILFITNRSKNLIENHFDDYSELIMHLEQEQDPRLTESLFGYGNAGIQFFSIRQTMTKGKSKPNGTGGAVLAGENFVNNEPFVVAFGDSIIRSPESPNLLKRLIDSHINNQSDTTIASYEIPENMTQHYGIVAVDHNETHSIDSRVVSILEKPQPEHTSSRLAISARYVFNPDIFTRIRHINPASNGELYLTDAIAEQIRNKKIVRTLRLNEQEKRYDIGNHIAYFKTFIDYAISDPDHGSEVREYLKKFV
ncbi:MAG: UTP--glucose-1-phosphate uridylyltransferase [Candidatus Latescibacterota bacterium]|nr:UTP--glucose-1-phosphate uridylyltransferase [Candidatus Latescibacterota bacterium]